MEAHCIGERGCFFPSLSSRRDVDDHSEAASQGRAEVSPHIVGPKT